MVIVEYEQAFAYTHDETGTRRARLTLRLSNPNDPGRAIDVDAFLDSGAERSLLNGWIGRQIGIDILDGPRLRYEPTAGNAFEAALHPVRIEHPDLGAWTLTIGFSLSPIRRCLLGRDFFNLVQIGFREHHLTFFVSPRP